MDRVFSSAIYGPSAKRAGHKSKGKKQGFVTYSTDRENEDSKIFITGISLVCVWGVQEQFLFTRNGFKFLTQPESKVRVTFNGKADKPVTLISRLNILEFGAVGFCGGRKTGEPREPGENPWSKPQTNNTCDSRSGKLSLDHSGGRQVLSPLRQPTA